MEKIISVFLMISVLTVSSSSFGEVKLSQNEKILVAVLIEDYGFWSQMNKLQSLVNVKLFGDENEFRSSLERGHNGNLIYKLSNRNSLVFLRGNYDEIVGWHGKNYICNTEIVSFEIHPNGTITFEYEKPEEICIGKRSGNNITVEKLVEIRKGIYKIKGNGKFVKISDSIRNKKEFVTYEIFLNQFTFSLGEREYVIKLN